MDLDRIKKVVEVRNWEEVNRYLDLGWHILHTYTDAYDYTPPMVYAQTLVYSLGWEGPDPKYPTPKYDLGDTEVL